MNLQTTDFILENLKHVHPNIIAIMVVCTIVVALVINLFTKAIQPIYDKHTNLKNAITANEFEKCKNQLLKNTKLISKHEQMIEDLRTDLENERTYRAEERGYLKAIKEQLNL